MPLSVCLFLITIDKSAIKRVYFMWPNYNINTPSPPGTFKVMLHNSKSQRGATSHSISVLKQSETAASRWKTRADYNKKTQPVYPFSSTFLFKCDLSCSTFTAGRRKWRFFHPVDILEKVTECIVTFCPPHKIIWGRTTRISLHIFFFSCSQPSVLSEVMQVFSLSFKLSFSCFSWGLNQHRICRKQMIRTSWHSVKHRKKKKKVT